MIQSLIPSLVALGTAALVAVALSLIRSLPAGNSAGSLAAARALQIAVIIQSLHFAEEALTGFHVKLGALFGLPAMSLSFFLVFNLCWIAIWVASIGGVRSGHRAAFFAAWFLAIAGIINGVAHPLLAIESASYFPGLVTSPAIAGASAWLWLMLLRATTGRTSAAN